MTAGILLGTYGAAAGLLGPAALGRPWTRCAPRLAISLWLGLSLSWVLSVILAALTMTVPLSLSWPESGPGSGGPMLAGRMAAGGAAGLLLAAAVSLRACGCLASGLRRARRERRQHAGFVAATGRPDRGLGAVIIDAGVPQAYCLPYGGQRVVVSTGALDVLSPGQLQAVLAHERAHLRGRHHLMLTAVSALARAFPRVPLLAQAGPQLAFLAEMAADDAAARSHDPASLAAALVVLARAGARAGALTAGGVAAAARVERMLAPPARPGWPARSARLAGAAAALALPATLACLPLLAVACGVAGRP
jgi:Zn-dependent protease with chaperone function